MREGDIEVIKQKVIQLKVGGKTIHQFIVYDSAVVIAERQGISREQYITELAKIELKEWRRKQNA